MNMSEKATHSSTLAWKIPRAEEPGGLQSMGSQRVGHDRSNLAAAAAAAMNVYALFLALLSFLLSSGYVIFHNS